MIRCQRVEGRCLQPLHRRCSENPLATPLVFFCALNGTAAESMFFGMSLPDTSVVTRTICDRRAAHSQCI